MHNLKERKREYFGVGGIRHWPFFSDNCGLSGEFLMEWYLFNVVHVY